MSCRAIPLAVTHQADLAGCLFNSSVKKKGKKRQLNINCWIRGTGGAQISYIL